MAKNGNLNKAKSAKNDEFYTMLSDIENELKYYKDQFKNKVIYCNCDDARQSNFFKYFSLNFEFLGLKKLISTSYNENGHGTILVYEGDKNGNHKVDDEEIFVKELNGNGDFRSDECINLLDEADIIVTNPPFSLFREFFSLLVEHNKKFLIIGNYNASKYRDIFPYIKQGNVWLGHNYVKEFIQPNNEIKKFGNICWYTNLEIEKAETPTYLYEIYDEQKYVKYDNYNAINVNRIKDIPIDYNEAIGVPITIFDKIFSDGLIHFKNPNNDEDILFKIIGLTSSLMENTANLLILEGNTTARINNKDLYSRVLIKKVID